MPKKKPVVIPPPPHTARRAVVIPPDQPRCWSFSFKFWRQIDYFGCGGIASDWFMTLLEKLSELSKEPIDHFRASIAKRDYWRYHEINWSARNIPIARKDLNWIDRNYLENEEEFPFHQFQVSLGLGRVIGFWDRDTFYVVLLDPLHNMQPSGQFGYRVRPTTKQHCLYSTLLHDVERAKGMKCSAPDCQANTYLRSLPNKGHDYNVTIIRIDDEMDQQIQAAIATQQIHNLHDVIEWGLLNNRVYVAANAPK